MLTQRKIVVIDEEKCDGCGQCVPVCAEGAIQIIDGKARLVVLACSKGGLARAISEDEGRTWSPMGPTGIGCGVPPLTVEPIDNGRTLLTWYHIGAPSRGDASPLSVWQAASHDGGLTWGEARMICIVEGKDKTAYARSKRRFDPNIDGAVVRAAQYAVVPLITRRGAEVLLEIWERDPDGRGRHARHALSLAARRKLADLAAGRAWAETLEG